MRAIPELCKADTAIAGGKGANLGELVRAGFHVPPGFVVTAPAYLPSMEVAGVRAQLRSAGKRGRVLRGRVSLREQAQAIVPVGPPDPMVSGPHRVRGSTYALRLAAGAAVPAALQISRHAELGGSLADGLRGARRVGCKSGAPQGRGRAPFVLAPSRAVRMGSTKRGSRVRNPAWRGSCSA